MYKVIFLPLITLFCFLLITPHSHAEENFFHVDISYPKQVRLGNMAEVFVTLPPIMPEDATPIVKISTSTSPQEDFTILHSFPASTINFHKAGHYAFSVEIGFTLKDL